MKEQSSEAFGADVRAALAQCRGNVRALQGSASGLESSAVIEQFDSLCAPLASTGGRVGLYANAHPDASMRETCLELEQELAEFQTEVSLDRGLFECLAALETQAGDLAGASPGHARALEHGLRDFRRSGVDRPEADRIRIRELQQELVRLGQAFDLNIIQSSTEFVIEQGAAGLAGLPADYIAAHPEREDGTVVISTDPADRQVFMTYAEDGELRRRYHFLCANLAVPENLEVLPQLLAARFELAGLLGHAHWADHVTEDKMVKSAATARAFLERIVALAGGRAELEFGELLAEKRNLEPEAAVVEEWERSFLLERLKRRRFEFDSQELRSYFPYARVRSGLLSVCSELYGVEFRENKGVPVWHSAVECFDILKGGELTARVFLDMHPRADKFKHGAMFPLASGPGVLPEGALVCNFNAPSGDDPGLLLPEEVRTFFHEFGHLLHQLFAGRQSFFAFSGIATEFDFVEVPSQMFEEWARSHAVLSRFAEHHATGDPLPEALVDRMNAASSFGRGEGVLGQMFCALLSLTYYDRDPEGLDLLQVMLDLKQRLLKSPHHEGTHFHASFGHLHGYSALYYTYMWSLVIAKDLFTRFERDPMDSGIAAEYRARVLDPGGSQDAEELVRGFLGRNYGYAAFETWLSATADC